MRVLLSGAFGYLGGRLAEALPHEVVLGARQVPDWAARYLKEREVRALDVLSSEPLEPVLEGVDAVVHLASLDENEASRDPELAMRVSGEGTRRLLAASRSVGVQRFVYLSTFHVYGPDASPHLDERSPVHPCHPYAISRLAGEGFCYQSNRSGEAPRTTVLRMSNGYGAPVAPQVDRWSLAHNDFCRQAFHSRRIVLKTSGVQHRDMVWIGDVAQAIDLVLKTSESCHELYHVGGGESLSMFALAERVRARAQQRLGADVTIERPPGPDHANPVQFSIERLRQRGYTPHDEIDSETDRILDLLSRETAER